MKDGTLEKELIQHKAHWGHSASVWHPRFQPFILREYKGVHIIDVRKTAFMLNKAIDAIKTMVENNMKILFVGTKEGIAPILEDVISPLKMPYITHKWIPGLLTNFDVVRGSIKKMKEMRELVTSGEIHLYTKKERLKIIRNLIKMEKKYMSIENMLLPHALFVIDPGYENIAIKEANLMGIPIFAIIDSNSDPTVVNYPIPANDDTPESVRFILEKIAEAIKETIIEKCRRENRPLPEFKKIERLTIAEYLKQVEERKQKTELSGETITQPAFSSPAEDKEKDKKEKSKRGRKRFERGKRSRNADKKGKMHRHKSQKRKTQEKKTE